MKMNTLDRYFDTLLDLLIKAHQKLGTFLHNKVVRMNKIKNFSNKSCSSNLIFRCENLCKKINLTLNLKHSLRTLKIFNF